GVLKWQFCIMKTVPKYPIHTQAQISAALAAIHDFIRLQDPTDDLFQFTQTEEINLSSIHSDQFFSLETH
ncbi:hypothetical protein F5880DRAFT_1488568, partial [Lentinula raphanica]